MSEATSRPWAATTRRGSWDWVVYQVSNPNIEICQPFHDGTEDNPTGEANAALIVQAVNSFDHLQARNRMLEEALRPIVQMRPAIHGCDCALCKIMRAAEDLLTPEQPSS